MRRLTLPLCLLALAACVPHKIPGTDLDDTDDTRSVIDLMQKYRKAVEKKDTETIYKMADKDFRDDGGSVNPDDDIDYENLKTRLNTRLSKVSELKLDLSVRRIEFDEDAKVARVTYSYQLNFKIPEYTSRSQSEGDIKQMLLKRDGAGWKIASGI